MKRFLAFGFLALLFQPLFAETATIQNEFLRLDYDATNHQFTITHLPDGKVFATTGESPILSAGKSYASATLPMIGGSGLSVTDSKGQQFFFQLKPGSPFLLMHETMKNVTQDNADVGKIAFSYFNLNLGGSPGKWMVRGTGGLHEASEYAQRMHPIVSGLWDMVTRSKYKPLGGSYEWLAVADRDTRAGMVAGWVSQERATGILSPRFIDGQLTIDAQSEYGHLLLKPDEIADSETLAIGYFDDVRLGLEKWADEIAKNQQIKLPPQPAGYCTWYAEEHGGSSDEKNVAVLSDFIKANLKSYGMSFVQIDDGWQLGDSHHNGPNKNFTDANPKGPFPSGMKATADQIKADGLTPGLWFIPFGGTYNDDWFADKQDLFMKGKDGKPFDTAWGGTCLDMTNPKARDYVKGVVNNIVNNWGFTYLKMDGFCTGLGAKQIYINSDYNDDNWGEAVLSDPSKTYIDAFRSGIQLVRETAGPNVFLLGCNTAQNMRVFGASFGLLDAMRIGPDNAGDWNSWVAASPLYGSREYFLNGRVWYNDPDPNYVRPKLTLDEARTAASWTSISGQLYTNGDWIPGLPADRLDIIKRTVAPHGKTARPVDFLENDPPRIWQVTDDTGPVRRDIVAFFNWSDAEEKIDVPIKQLNRSQYVYAGTGRPLKIWEPRYALFDFWNNQFLPDATYTVSVTLPPHGCKIIAMRPVTDFPFILSTSAHVTQGMTDILEEHWDEATHTLSGKSRVVGSDPYELRLATPDPAQHWKIFQAGLDDFHSPNGVTIDKTGDKDHRARFTAAKDGIVSWLFVF